MYRVEKAVLQVKLKQPYLDWVKSLPEPGDFTLEVLNEENHIYLIPEYETTHELKLIIQKLYPEIFEVELGTWYKDKKLWPERRGYATFMEWFDLHVHSMVFDSYEDKIEKEEFWIEY